MNSIESYSPSKVSSIDGDAKDTSNPDSDPIALKTLRALMGSIVPQDLPRTPEKMVAKCGEISTLTLEPLIPLLTKPSITKDITTPEAIEQQPNEASLGQSILQSLGAHSSAATASNVESATSVSGTSTLERVQQVSALMTEMADRVLVTDPVHGQTPEVRVKIADNLMPGTEVRVWRENGDELRVAFDTNSAYWARVLNDASPMLAQRLNDRLPLVAPPQIVVQQQGGQPEDGHSRNRQNPWEVAQDATEA